MHMSCLRVIGYVIVFFCVICTLIFGILLSMSDWLPFRAIFVDEQTRSFESQREFAVRSSSPEEIVGALANVVGYYPSGTKQTAGSRLDRIVERQRASAIREIIAHLRKHTDQNLGDLPEPWIQKYTRQSRTHKR